MAKDLKTRGRCLRRFVPLAAAILMLETTPSLGAEITCLQQIRRHDFTTEMRAGLSKSFPSGRLPAVGSCYGKILIKGMIEASESTKFAALLRNGHPFIDEVLLWSAGGSLEEAIKIGRLIRKGLLKTIAPEDLDSQDGGRPTGRGSLKPLAYYAEIPPIRTDSVLFQSLQRPPICRGNHCHCASACFLIWASGVERNGSSLGLHRPTSKSTTFTALSPDRASLLYRELLLQMGNYLTEMEIPRRFIDVMMDTSSAEIKWIGWNDADAMRWPPSIDEWLTSSCGARTGAIDLQQLQINQCRAKKIHNSRDAISTIN